MKNTFYIIIIGCCAVFFCAAPVFANTSGSLNATGTSSDSTVGGESVSCDGQLSKPHGKGSQPLSVMDTIDTCQRWHSWLGVRPTTQEEYKMQYDSLRRYIESCGKNNDSYDAFNGLAGAVEFMSNDSTRYDIYRAWLISVLYINTTQPYFFCACLEAIGGTYQNGKYHPLGYLAVLNYIRNNDTLCWSTGDEQLYQTDSIDDALNGYDPTHLPSLDSLGLGFLFKTSGVASPLTPLSSQYLASFTSSPNPFINETSLEFTLNRMSYVTLAVYDELGRLVWGYPGSSLEAGMHSIQIDGRSLPSGTLYARISTGFGEVKTVKLVHEK